MPSLFTSGFGRTPSPLPLDCRVLRANSFGPKDLAISQRVSYFPFSEKQIPCSSLLLATSANGNSMPLGFQVQIPEGTQNSILLFPRVYIDPTHQQNLLTLPSNYRPNLTTSPHFPGYHAGPRLNSSPPPKILRQPTGPCVYSSPSESQLLIPGDA